MKVDVVLHAGLLDQYDFTGKVAVVIDVFRATSVITEGLRNGAKKYIPVGTIEEAHEYKSCNPEVLLGGERDGKQIEGFDLDNSPLSYTKNRVEDATIVGTTTNGTRALRGVSWADKVYLASFRNLSAVVSKLIQYDDVVLVCSGSENGVSLEDSVCAGGIVYHLELHASVTCSDTAIMLKSVYGNNVIHLHEFLSAGEHYKYLASIGMQPDLDFCLAVNKTTIVPYFDGMAVTAEE